ncbi:MAG: SGNH/GDSL hydrolase family protein [Bacilli bacterium]|nr:SGNH/GDSL hydrolase family protein [Bacilli bacterium]
MKKQHKTLLVLAALALASCGGGTTSEISSTQSNPVSTPTSEQTKTSIDFSSIVYVDDLLWFPTLELEVGQKEFIGQYLLEFEGSEILIEDESSLSLEGEYIVPKKEGTTYLVYHAQGKYQKVQINVAPKGTYKRAYTFDDADLEGKNVCNFGDSVSCDWTVGDEVSIYARRFAAHYKMNMVANYAIGGTVSIYPSFNANVTSEYKGTEFMYNDGCDMVYNKAKNGTLATMDMMFITYGYNDCYFQPDIDCEQDQIVCTDGTFANCHSYKGYYRYMIDTARKANPNIKIVIMNIIYNEYDIDHNGYKHNPNYSFDKGIKYADYRKAIFEIGYEKDVKVIDEWNYMKGQYDYYEGRPEGVSWCYKDNVHPSVFGNKKIANYSYKF